MTFQVSVLDKSSTGCTWLDPFGDYDTKTAEDAVAWAANHVSGIGSRKLRPASAEQLVWHTTPQPLWDESGNRREEYVSWRAEYVYRASDSAGAVSYYVLS